jgi:6,7-dimethyl-8-ribityllumazine synthase
VSPILILEALIDGRCETLKTELEWSAASAESLRFAVISTRWNAEFIQRLRHGVDRALAERGTPAVEHFQVPGAFELPLACLKAGSSGRYDAIIALGVVIRGDTPHFDYVAGEAAAGLMRASLDSGVPVMFGVITADTIDQVIERCGDGRDNKGYEAALSAIEMIHTMRAVAGIS